MKVPKYIIDMMETRTIEPQIVQKLNPIQTGGGGVFDATQDLKPLLLTIASTVFLLRDFSSNLPGNNLVLLGFGS